MLRLLERAGWWAAFPAQTGRLPLLLALGLAVTPAAAEDPLIGKAEAGRGTNTCRYHRLTNPHHPLCAEPVNDPVISISALERFCGNHGPRTGDEGEVTKQLLDDCASLQRSRDKQWEMRPTRPRDGGDMTLELWAPDDTEWFISRGYVRGGRPRELFWCDGAPSTEDHLVFGFATTAGTAQRDGTCELPPPMSTPPTR